MKIQLHEIELSAKDVAVSTSFYNAVLGLQPVVQQEGLTVFNSGEIDFNLSTHHPSGEPVISFITDNLAEIEGRLKEAGISYQPPAPSHLGMTCIQFKDPSGYCLKINMPGPESPSWLKEKP